ncbi:MAG: epoxyqueuosine reductase QueH [Candidatus Cryptobacteroides sp.]
MAKKGDDTLQVPFGESRVLLHTCCAPCSGAIIERLLQEGVTPVIFYCNPNIYPYREYEIRKGECSRYAFSLGLEIVDDDYDHEAWLESVRGLEKEPERGGRCLKCFKFRLLRAAEYAAANGFRVLTTTLASSRWKSLDQINEAGRWACAQVALKAAGRTGAEVNVQQTDARTEGPVWWERNWRKGGLQERRSQIIREQNFYNQLYCGCEFSMPETVKCDMLAVTGDDGR